MGNTLDAPRQNRATWQDRGVKPLTQLPPGASASSEVTSVVRCVACVYEMRLYR